LPLSERPYWDEHIAYLPHSSIYCELPQAIPASQSRDEYGFPEQAIVLCALHMPRKIDPECFNAWLAILRANPQTILWLVEESAAQSSNLKAYAAERNVSAERLIFAPVVSLEQHLARYRCADIFLDTFVFNGHTTVIDALSMGVPVVTRCGESPCARGAASLVRAHGLPEMIADTTAAYVAIVQRYLDDAVWRDEIKSRAGHHASSDLFCPERRVREIEAAYEVMWAGYQAGLPPNDFDVPPKPAGQTLTI
jgi:predicted O-linked N-acetylglucosamine transferase (SPINDLY family)